MKIVDKYPFVTIDYPTKKASVFVIVVFGLPFLLSGLFLLIGLVVGQGAEENALIVLGIAGGVFTVIGALVIIYGIKLALKTDRLIIDFNTGKIIRIFGLGAIYDQYTKGDNEYSLDSVETLFIDRDIHIMLKTEEGRTRPAPVYILICGFQDPKGNKVVLHAGNLTTVKTVEVLAKKLEKDIWDFTAIEERKIPQTHTELLEEIRYPSTRFVKITILGFLLVIGLFLLPFLFDMISGMFPGLETLFETLTRFIVIAWIVNIIFLAFWMCTGMIREGLKCPRCSYEKREVTCEHCGLEIPVFITIGFGPCSYRYLLRE